MISTIYTVFPEILQNISTISTDFPNIFINLQQFSSSSFSNSKPCLKIPFIFLLQFLLFLNHDQRRLNQRRNSPATQMSTYNFTFTKIQFHHQRFTFFSDPTQNPHCIYQYDMLKPFFMHPSDNLSLSLVTPHLSNTNYHSWSCSIKMSLLSKN